jgi:hypothetical protein
MSRVSATKAFIAQEEAEAARTRIIK